MLGTLKKDLPIRRLLPLSTFGASNDYRMDVRNSWQMAAPNMAVSNKPSEHNIMNIPVLLNQVVLPMQKPNASRGIQSLPAVLPASLGGRGK